jgi:hypothetical protein
MQRIKTISTIPDFLKADKEIKKYTTSKKRFLAWVRLFEKPYKNLFDIYYNWGNRQCGRKRFINYKKNFNKEQIIKNEKYALKVIPVIVNKIAKILPFSETLLVILFVGLKWSNGFVDKYKNKYSTFLNLECYNDVHTLKIFICHELIHNIHLRKNPIYYWKRNKVNWYNTLILEGFATYITKQALRVSLQDALWGNYLTSIKRKGFVIWCNKNIIFLKREFLKEVDKTKRVESRFFGAKKIKGCSYYRTGYFLGFKFVEWLLKQMTIQEVISLKGEKLKRLVKKFLKDN